MFRGGQPYTNFRSVNVTDGIVRFEGKPFGNRLEVASKTLTAARKVDVCDASGSMFIKGYHILFGSVVVTGQMSNVPVHDYMKCSAVVAGVKTTSFILANVYSTATAAGMAVGAVRCTTANALDVLVTNVTNATISDGVLAINYMVLNQQTS